MITTIIFDLSGVFFNDGLTESIKKIGAQVVTSPEKIKELLDGPFAEEYRTGKITADAFWKKVSMALNNADISLIKDIFFNAYAPQEETVALIQELKKQGYTIAYLSNAPPDRTEYLNNKFNFLRYFDCGVFSFEAKARKPSKEVFRYFLKKYSLHVENCLYIDDNASNLVPAQELGMKCVHFIDVQQTRKALEQLKLL